MGDVEELGRAEQFRRLPFVASELGDTVFDGVAVFGVLVLDDGDRNAIDDEHNIGPVAPTCGGLKLPFPGDMKEVLGWGFEVDDLDVSVALLGLVVPLPLAAQPGKHLTVAFNRRPDRLQALNDLTSGVGGHPRIELFEPSFKFFAKEHAFHAASLLAGIVGRDRGPADLGRVVDHRKLDSVRFGYVDCVILLDIELPPCPEHPVESRG